MSRIGKKPILIPENVEVKIEGQKVTIKGPKGELSQEMMPEIRAELKEKELFISPVQASTLKSTPKREQVPFGARKRAPGQAKKIKTIWGLTRSLIANMIKGVTSGYEKKLQIEGLGYRANVEGEKLVLWVGFTHLVSVKIPEGLKVLVEKNIITVSGIDKELVGQFSSKIRKIKPPEPYKGKGIRYIDEVVRRKAGKKAVTTE